MKKTLLWIGTILLILGAIIYIDHKKHTTEGGYEESGGATFGRSYNEPIVDTSAVGMSEQYRNNPVRFEAEFDGKLIRISGVASEIQSTDDGGAAISLSGFPFFPNSIVYALGGSEFKAGVANINMYEEVILLCYLGDEHVGNPVVVDCIFNNVVPEDKIRKEIGGEEQNEEELSSFTGCYTVSKDNPAQIKVSKDGFEWTMQMKEPNTSHTVWDPAEPLEVISRDEIPKFFSIDPDHIDAIISRPDRVFVLAHIKPEYANIDPLLDGEYISYLYDGANVIYKVDCDDIKMSF